MGRGARGPLITVQEARVGAEYWLLILLIVFALAGLETYLAQKFSQSA